MTAAPRANASTAVDRSRLPDAGPARSFTFPPIQRSVLPSGLRVWTVPHPSVPIVTFVLLVRCGSSTDPPGQEGLAALTADMLDEGSGGRTAIEMHEALARIGAQFDIDIGSDAAIVSATALSRFADRALALVGDMVARPALSEPDFARVSQLRLHRLMQLRDLPGAVADRTFLRLIYGGHPYGHTPIGFQEALAALTVDDVRRFHTEVIRPTAATLIAVGECEHERIEALARDAFAGWEGPVVGHTIPPTVDTAARDRLNVVPRPGAPQSELRIGHVGAARNSLDYHPLLVANMILGGQFVSRINLNLREHKGFTYGARTSFDFRRMRGPFVLQVGVQTAATAPAIHESLAEIAAMREARPATEEEVALSIAALTRGYARNFETGEQIARAATQLSLYDLPDDYFARFVPQVESVTTADVTRVMATHVDPGRLVTLVVGDLDVVRRDLEQLELGEPAILSPDAF